MIKKNEDGDVSTNPRPQIVAKVPERDFKITAVFEAQKANSDEDPSTRVDTVEERVDEPNNCPLRVQIKLPVVGEFDRRIELGPSASLYDQPFERVTGKN